MKPRVLFSHGFQFVVGDVPSLEKWGTVSWRVISLIGYVYSVQNVRVSVCLLFIMCAANDADVTYDGYCTAECSRRMQRSHPVIQQTANVYKQLHTSTRPHHTHACSRVLQLTFYSIASISLKTCLEHQIQHKL